MEKTKLQARYEAARRSLDRAGHKVSAGSWIDETAGKYYVCSVESGQGGIYGHPCTKSAEMKKRTGPSGGSDNLTPNERRRKMIIKIQKRMRARETIAYMMKMIGIMHDGRSAGRLKRMFR